MAKKEVKKPTVSRLGELLKHISKTVPIYIETDVEEKEYISTGVYILDAAISGKLLDGGIASNRITSFAGESGTGKSYLAYSCIKEAQNKGYEVMLIDTENAIDLIDFPKYGVDIDPLKFHLIRCNKAEDIDVTLTQIIDSLKSDKMNGIDISKTMIVLDSLGQMSSNKEKIDLLKGELKQDMTRAKALNALFRSVTVDLGYLKIPLLVCNQTYQTMDFIPQEKQKGGNGLQYAASIICYLSKSKLKTGEEDDLDLGQSGINVTCKVQKNRMGKSKKVKFNISFLNGMNPYTGLDYFCTKENFDKVGIAQGKMQIDKTTGEMKFIPGGNRWYVRHLDKSFTSKNLFNSIVFNEDVLKALDQITNDYFRFSSVDEIEEIRKNMESNLDEKANDKHDDNGFVDEEESDDMFDDN